MESMNNNNNNNNTSEFNNCSNWLGFSLSPQMKMEVHSNCDSSQVVLVNHEAASSVSAAAAVPNSSSCSFYVSNSSPFNGSPSFSFGNGKHGAFNTTTLSVMPLKSDGSLCIPPPQGMMQGSSPKLEDFLGGATMEAHHYSDNESETMMGLSLDSMYYHQQNTEHETDRHCPVHSPNQFYNGLQCTTQLAEDHCNSVEMTQLGDHSNFPFLKNWISGYYYATSTQNNELDQHQQQITTSNNMVVSEGGACFGPLSTVACGGDLQSLTLSMSPGSQSSCVPALNHILPTGDQGVAIEPKKRGPVKMGHKQPVHRKSIDTFGQRTSQYRGVTRHRWTGRYEAHLWDNSCKKEGQTRKGRQVYLGGYDMEDKAARAYDLAALKYWGPSTHINFPLENYKEELEGMKTMNRQEYVAHLRRKSSGFSRGASMYRGVTRHHQHGRWQARIGRVAGNKDLYLGTFSTQEEAAEAYDIAAIKFRGVSAVTNFDITRYDVEKIMASNTLLAAESARRNKIKDSTFEAIEYNPSAQSSIESARHVGSNDNASNWKMVLFQSHPQQEGALCVEQPVEMHDLVGMEAPHFSNPSSIVTSLSSSREDSPDRSGTTTMLFAKPPLASKFISPATTAPTTSNSTWFQSANAHLRPDATVSMAHLPVFAAWGDI